MQHFQNVQNSGRKRYSGVKLGRDVDISDEEKHIQDELFATSGSRPEPSQTGNLVLPGQNKNITDSTKDSPLRITGSNVKLDYKRSQKSKQALHRKHYEPSNDTKTFFINSQGHP